MISDDSSLRMKQFHSCTMESRAHMFLRKGAENITYEIDGFFMELLWRAVYTIRHSRDVCDVLKYVNNRPYP